MATKSSAPKCSHTADSHDVGHWAAATPGNVCYKDVENQTPKTAISCGPFVSLGTEICQHVAEDRLPANHVLVKVG